MARQAGHRSYWFGHRDRQPCRHRCLHRPPMLVGVCCSAHVRCSVGSPRPLAAAKGKHSREKLLVPWPLSHQQPKPGRSLQTEITDTGKSKVRKDGGPAENIRENTAGRIRRYQAPRKSWFIPDCVRSNVAWTSKSMPISVCIFPASASILRDSSPPRLMAS
jgi:hypothetical protein